MRWIYSPGYDYGGGIPGMPSEVHGFLLRKPSEIRRRLIEGGGCDEAAFEEPVAVSRQDLELVHDPALIRDLDDPRAVALAIELGEIAEMPADLVRQAVVEPQLLAAGGTILCLRAALEGEWAINLSGGFHHARRNLAHGFCLVADVAIAIHRLRSEGARRRYLIIDLDLHQGDGNATLFENDPEVFTVSVHEEELFPYPKAHSDLDIGLPSYAGDDAYLAAVDEAIAGARARFEPHTIIYVAGSDPYAGDPLGTLNVTATGMLERDRRVALLARDLHCPLVVLPAGGYSADSPRITAAGFKAIAELNSTT